MVDAIPVGPTCPTVADPVLADLCSTAESGAIISSSEQPGTTFEQSPASAGTTASGGNSITSTQSCTYFDTLYASGSGSGDHLYGYTTNLGAKASAHAHSTFPATSPGAASAPNRLYQACKRRHAVAGDSCVPQ